MSSSRSSDSYSESWLSCPPADRVQWYAFLADGVPFHVAGPLAVMQTLIRDYPPPAGSAVELRECSFVSGKMILGNWEAL